MFKVDYQKLKVLYRWQLNLVSSAPIIGRPIGVGSEPISVWACPPKNTRSITFTIVSQIGANSEIKFPIPYQIVGEL